MKSSLSVLMAAAMLAGCIQNPLVKNSEPEVTASTQPNNAAPPAPAPAAQASAPVLPPCAEPAPPQKANSKDKKAKPATKPKTTAPAQPCAAPSQAAAPTTATAPVRTAVPAVDPAKREVKGVNDWTGYIQGTPAPGTKFSALKIGMGQKEVMDIAGPPTDQQSNVTGKAFIPFYMGAGRYETWLHYKGMGRLLFAGNGGMSTGTGLIGIEHDASERGYK